MDRVSTQNTVSTWRVTALGVATLRQQVQGGWTRARLRACWPRLRRLLGESRRQRLHQETLFRTSFAELERASVLFLRG